MITVLLSIVFLILQGFGINVIQDWQAMLIAGILEFSVDACVFAAIKDLI